MRGVERSSAPACVPGFRKSADRRIPWVDTQAATLERIGHRGAPPRLLARLWSVIPVLLQAFHWTRLGRRASSIALDPDCWETQDSSFGLRGCVSISADLLMSIGLGVEGGPHTQPGGHQTVTHRPPVELQFRLRTTGRESAW